MRPITSSIGSPTYAVSKYLVSVLSPLRKNTFTVQNSCFTQQIKQHSISSQEVIVSLDGKSQFTSIPVDLTLSITKERLQRDQNPAERTNLSVVKFMWMFTENQHALTVISTSFPVTLLLYFPSRIRPQCCMLHVLKSEFSSEGWGEGGRGWGTRPPLSEFSGSAPTNLPSSE